MGKAKSPIEGVPVSMLEVLRELGHPSIWGIAAREAEKLSLLRGDAVDIDYIYGVKTYLTSLHEQMEEPVGSGTGLISQEENRLLIEAERTRITSEIAIYTRRLDELEKNPIAIQEYLDHLLWKLAVIADNAAYNAELENVDPISLEIMAGLDGLSPAEYLKKEHDRLDAERKKNQEEIDRCKTLLEKLTTR